MHLLTGCSSDLRDRVLLMIWRIWDIRNDLTHGKEAPPVLASVEFLDSYYKSMRLAGCYSVEEIVKGKMSTLEMHSSVPKPPSAAAPWPAPAAGTVALLVDGSFQPLNGAAAAGMVLRDM